MDHLACGREEVSRERDDGAGRIDGESDAWGVLDVGELLVIDESDLSAEADGGGGVADPDVGGAGSVDRPGDAGIAEERVRVVAVRHRPPARVDDVDTGAVSVDMDQVGETADAEHGIRIRIRIRERRAFCGLEVEQGELAVGVGDDECERRRCDLGGSPAVDPVVRRDRRARGGCRSIGCCARGHGQTGGEQRSENECAAGAGRGGHETPHY